MLKYISYFFGSTICNIWGKLKTRRQKLNCTGQRHSFTTFFLKKKKNETILILKKCVLFEHSDYISR